jgi:hypothetical protein
MATYKKWTEAELQYIRSNLTIFSDEELAVKLCEMTGETITYGMVRRQRRKLGVSKPRGRRKKNVVKLNPENNSNV